MATIPNNDPVPSNAPRNLKFNAEKMDQAINSPSAEYTDRLGINRKTWAGIEADSTEKLAEIDNIITSLDTANFTFASESSGLAATTEGQYFRAFQDINGFVLFRYYQNVAEAAVFKGSLLGNAASEDMAAMLSSLGYFTADEYDTDKQYPVIDTNKRLLCWWMGSDYYIPGSVYSGSINTHLLNLEGYEFPTRFVKNNGYFDEDIALARLDVNNRVMELIRGSEYLTTAQQLGDRRSLIQVADGEFDTDFNYAMLDTNHRIIILRTNDGKVSGGVAEDDKVDEGNIFIGEVVLDGTRLLQFHADTGNQTLLTTSSMLGNVLNHINDGYYQFTDSADADAIGQLLYSPYDTYEPRAKFGRKSISFFGHSFEGNNQKLSGDLYNLTGMKVYNFARSGALSRSIALRNDAYRLKYTPVGGVIPASGSVDFIEADAGPLEVLGSPAISDQLQVTFSDVRGYVTWDGTKMTFTRATPGDAVTVPQAAELIVLPYTSVVTSSVAVGTYYPGAHEAIHVLWIGRNNINYIAQIQSDLVAIVERIRSQHKRFVLCPEFTQTTEATGTTGYNAVYAVNAMYKSLYPENYCEIDGVDLLQNFRSNYNPSLPDDVSAYNAGTVPPSLLNIGDTLHPNNAGITINAAFINQFLIKKGWN